MKFKTNAKCEGCSKAIINGLQSKFPDAQLSLDLNSADRVLEVHGIPEDAEHAAQIERAIEETGFKGSWLNQASALNND